VASRLSRSGFTPRTEEFCSDTRELKGLEVRRRHGVFSVGTPPEQRLLPTYYFRLPAPADFIQQQYFVPGMDGYGEGKPQVHSGRKVLYRVIYPRTEFGKIYYFIII